MSDSDSEDEPPPPPPRAPGAADDDDSASGSEPSASPPAMRARPAELAAELPAAKRAAPAAGLVDSDEALMAEALAAQRHHLGATTAASLSAATSNSATVDQGDGRDAYGNPIDGAVVDAETTTMPLGNQPLDDSEMHIDARALPQQRLSFVADAAVSLEMRDAPIRLPQSLEPVERRPREAVVADLRRKLAGRLTAAARINPKLPKLEAVALQTRLYQHAFAASHGLIVLEKEDELARLLQSEERELMDACNSVPPPDDTLPARSTAVTVLMTGEIKVASEQLVALLDAAAHLASAIGCGGAPAAKKERVAFLHGRPAHGYLRARSAANAPARAERTAKLCLTTAHEGKLVSLVGKLEYHTEASSNVEEVQRVLATLHRQAVEQGCLLERGSALLGSFANAGEPKDAYAYHAAAVSHDFWSYLHLSLPPELSQHATHNPDFCGALDWSDLFLKLVPKQPDKRPIDHPDVTHGILLHQSGWEENARAFCRRRKREEAERNPNEPLFGLRPPLDEEERAMCPHVLFMHADEFTMGEELTSYGLRGVPGKRFDLQRGSRIPRLVRRLMPLNETLLNLYFVLPCNQLMCSPHPAHYNPILRLSLWKATEQAVQDYSYLFRDNKVHRGTRSETQFLESGPPPADAPPHPRVALSPPPDRDPTLQERVLSCALGAPLNCAAFRVGDVLNAVTPQDGEPPEALCSFLLGAAATVGSDASIEHAFELATVLLGESKQREAHRTLETEVAELRASAAAAEAVVAQLRDELEQARHASARPAAAAGPSPSCEGEGGAAAAIAKAVEIERRAAARISLQAGHRLLLTALKRTSVSKVVELKSPIKGASLKGVLRLLANPLGLDDAAQGAAYAWSKSEVCQLHYTDLLRLGCLLHKIVPAERKAILLWNDEPDWTQILQIKLGGAFVMGGPDATVCAMTLSEALAVDPETAVVLEWRAPLRQLSLAERAV